MKCPLCHQRKGKRRCQLNAAQLICPLCCASIRGAGCEGCSYFAPCLAYQQEKASKHFAAVVIDALDDRCDEALQLAEKGELAQAEALLEAIRREHPEYHTLLYALGTCHALRGQLDPAIACFEKAVASFPPFAHAHYNLGLAYRKKARIAQAARAFEAAIAIDGRDGAVGKRARQELDNLAAIVGESGWSLSDYLAQARLFDSAFAALREGHYQASIDLFARMLQADPTHVQAHGNMGLAHARLGQRSAALACLDKALELDPAYEPALYNRLIVERLAEGETLPGTPIHEVDYYTDFRHTSYLQKLTEELAAAGEARSSAEKSS